MISQFIRITGIETVHGNKDITLPEPRPCGRTTGLDPVMTGVINRLICQVRRRRPVTSVVVTHDLSTVRAVADRVVMLEPISRLAADEPQAIFSGTVAEAFASDDPRVAAFMQGGGASLEREAG